MSGYRMRKDWAPELRDAAWLAEQYTKHDANWIAWFLGVEPPTVFRWLKRHGIPTSRRPGGNDGTHVSA